MKLYLMLILLAGLLLLPACEEDPTGANSAGEVIIRGQIFNQITSQPVDSAVVQVKQIIPELATLTDAQGKYELKFQVDQAQNVLVIGFKETFISDSTTVVALGDRIIDVPPLQLRPTTATIAPSGNAASIYLFNLGATSLGIRSSGDIEFTSLVFEAVDSVGNPVDPDHAIDIDFRLGGSPGGGEFLHPSTVTTGLNGKAETFFFSGTTAGAVQVYAEATVNGATIVSEPITLNIYGGLPNEDHFSFGVEKLNIPGWHINGVSDRVTAIVGDKFSNPVRPGTPVYFSTSGGIIEGGNVTNSTGQASVNLYSADPRPPGGFAIVEASTVDENEATISEQLQVLFSGPPILTVSPTTFNIPNQGQQTFTVQLRDLNGNPMSGGQVLQVSAQGPVAARGQTTVTLPDTQSPFWTNFSFSLADTDQQDSVATVFVTVRTSGPNGGSFVTFSGTSR